MNNHFKILFFTLAIVASNDVLGNFVPPNPNIRIELGEGIFWQDGNYFVRFTDYQGSVRVVVRACIGDRINPFESNIVEVNNFDPWGVEFGRAQNPFGVQDIKHQDMERLNFGEMNVHNHGARWAFNAVGRWLGMDPLMELFYSVSPFVYNMNNPVRFIDPDGRKALDMMTDLDGWFEDVHRNIVWDESVTSQANTPEGGTFLGQIHFSENTYHGLGGRAVSTCNRIGTINAMTEDFNSMGFSVANRYMSKADGFLSRIGWVEGMPTTVNLGENRFVVPYSGYNFINITDRSLRRAFYNSLDPIMRRTTLLDTRTLHLWTELAIWNRNPIPSVPNPSATQERVQNRHLNQLESRFRKRSIIR